ncbi:MAG: hypothetical protein RRB13_11370 [bacterium]|nr:hypothetical protein [bacterium]
MRYEITEIGRQLTIHIDQLQGEQDRLLKTFEGCQSGHCKCPTKEYKKLDALDVEVNPADMTLTLRAKEGSAINKDQLERCLKSTIEEVGKKRG